MEEASVIIEGWIDGINDTSGAFTVAAPFLIEGNEVITCIWEIFGQVAESLGIIPEAMDVVDNAFSWESAEGRISVAGKFDCTAFLSWSEIYRVLLGKLNLRVVNELLFKY